jgi:prepilin-type N-terminal cleavage/methylation domain-containing protein
MRRRGFTLIEVLVALLILAIVITTTIAMFGERQRRLRQANETILAYQALSNEVELWRRVSFSQIDSQPPVFKSDTSLLLRPMQPVAATVKVDTPRTDLRNVTLTLRWDNGQRTATIAFLRSDTGGSNLW